jgi:hypothetical protein
LNAFTKLINPDYLLIGVEILVINFFIVLLIIYINLYSKKRAFFFTQKIQAALEVWISQAILDELEMGESFDIPPTFSRILKKKRAKEFVIDELIKTKKNLTGNAAKNIITLYESLDLKKESLYKLGKRQWYIQAKGIHELYSMEQMDTLKRIYKNTNSSNEFVRMEAQTGVINMTGFNGLRFLDLVSYPITEWQQIKLLDQLHGAQETGQLSTHLPKWLASSNDTVIVFALKLAYEYQVFSAHHAVAKCLEHQNPSVASQAIKTLVRIANDSTPKILTNYYPAAKFTNQLLILDALVTIATLEEAWFLIALLDDESDIVKLKAGRALAHCFPQGLEALEERGRAPEGPYQNIYLHIKSEMER